MTSLWFNPYIFSKSYTMNYPFVFTSANTAGSTGPALSNLVSYYTTKYPSQSWFTSTSNFNTTSNIQYWTVPTTGNYTLIAAGAASNNWTSYTGGRGIVVSNTYSFTAGTTLKILIGQQGTNTTGYTSGNYAGYGAGGGTFVTTTSNAAILVAGGGGNPFNIISTVGGDAVTTTSGSNGTAGGTGGTAGSGAAATTSDHNGGAGLLGNACGDASTTVAQAYIKGGKGGTYGQPNGGFGGGGTIGGGGGYSGGACINFGQSGWGGGGGSYDMNNTTNNNAAQYTSNVFGTTLGYNLGSGFLMVIQQTYVLSNLISYWDFSNPISYSGTGTTFTDISPGGNINLTISNGGTYSSSPSPNMTFASSTYALSSTLTLNLASNGFTFELLIKPSSASSYLTMMSYCNSAIGTDGLSDGAFTMTSFPGTSWGFFTSRNANYTVPTGFSSGSWLHYVWTVNSSNIFTGYVNGVVVGTGTGFGPLPSSNSFALSLGNATQTVTPSKGMPGNYALGRVYQRPISGTEVYTNYASILGLSNPYSLPNYPQPLIYVPLFSSASTNIGSGSQTITINGTMAFTTIASKQCITCSPSVANYISIAYGSVVPSQFTVCFWFYRNDTTLYTCYGISDSVKTPGNNSNELDLLAGTACTTYAALPTQWTSYSTSSGTVNATTWYHYACTVNVATGTFSVYLNGALQGTGTGSATTWTSSINTIYLGTSADGARGFSGYMRQFQFYPSIISAANITYIYNSTA